VRMSSTHLLISKKLVQLRDEKWRMPSRSTCSLASLNHQVPNGEVPHG
jgi:hypothetical protein